MVNEWFSACSPVTDGVLPVFNPGSVWVNMFTNDTEELIVCTLVRFTDATQL